MLAGALAAACAAVWYHRWPIRHFGVVEEGVLYRGAQPDARGWRRLRDHFHIRTVMDLREDEPNEPWAVEERRFCAANGITYVKLPVGHDRLTDEQLRTVVETVSDPARRAVLIHCELGRSRTGVVVAAWRIVVEGWSCQVALAEWQRYNRSMNPGYVAYLKELDEGHGWRPGQQVADAGKPSVSTRARDSLR